MVHYCSDDWSIGVVFDSDSPILLQRKVASHWMPCPILVHYTWYGYNNIRSQTSWSCPAGCSVRHRVWVNTGSCLSVCFNRTWGFICRFVSHPATLCFSKEKKNITFKNYCLFMYQIMYSVCIPNELSLKRWSPTCIINFNPLRVSFIIYTV